MDPAWIRDFLKDEGNECVQTLQALADDKMQHKTTHERNFDEENVSPSGASIFNWTEHHLDPPLTATDGKENGNVDSMKYFSFNEPLYSHI